MRIILGVLTLTLLQLNAIAQFNYQATIKDAETKESLPSANVILNGQTSVSDIDGNVSFSGLKKGTYSLTVSFIGYDHYEANVVINNNMSEEILLNSAVFITEEVIVSATRANSETPVTFTNVNKESIEKQNFGQDLPILLNYTPSLVTTSDAGAGIGYTGLRIRGSDATRINVAINGVPLNDSESQGVFWVDIPDIASSTDNIQIQRGVGTSTNGAGAFGGSINLQTNTRQAKPYADIINAFGSYNTRRHTLGLGTGLIKDHWTVDVRTSLIKSDGYVDRATSDLKSYYFAAGYYGEKTMIKALAFGGAERTYQSWYGTPEAVLKNDVNGIKAVIANNGLNDLQAENMRTAGRTFNWYLYENEVDDYQQNHYQLHLSQRLADGINFNLSGHYTKGKGFYEQYKYNDDFEDYNLDNIVIGTDTITSGDLIRKRWLDNDFYGVTYSLTYERGDWNVVLGGAANEYDGDHYGELIQGEYTSNFTPGYRYYQSSATKVDFNTFIKAQYQLTDKLNVFADMQYRNIGYNSSGTDNDLKDIEINTNFDFFNPKFGVYYQLSNTEGLYASYAVANREPVRSDFIDSPVRSKSERLQNIEFGYKKTAQKVQLGFNGYFMKYNDQLILTGEVNDVGANVRVNVPKSYRAGIELEGAWAINKYLTWNANITFSENKIRKYTEILYDYGTNWDEYNIVDETFKDTDIAFSPKVIAGSNLTVKPFNNFEISLLSKYVGDQYLDNTSNENRKIDAYLVNDIRVSYSVYFKYIKQMTFSLLVNNVLNEEYSSNGYTFGYQAGAYVVRENYFYPQAPTNFLASLTIKF
jgi:iron complex outermembrane recepter protein